MKMKFLPILMFVFLSATAQKQEVPATSLPKAAQETLKYFDATVAKVLYENETSYEATLTDGTVINFDFSGNWSDIVSKSINPAILPEKVKAHYAKNYPGEKILHVSHNENGYEIDGSKNEDIPYNAKGEFIGGS